ncbi:MAG: Eco57I restriction-modification methylase domain-containing protein [bacterium]
MVLGSIDKIESSLVDFVEKLTDEYIQNSDLRERKSKRQFFTPPQVGIFMANMFTISKSDIHLLDPGAGTGMLSAAFCCRILNLDRPVSLSIDAFENDPKLIPVLDTVFGNCKSELEKKGHTLVYNITQKDFILNRVSLLKQKSLFEDSRSPRYDFIISNPPYYKLNKSSLQSQLMDEFTSGQPNIYAFFMALSLEMLKPGGQMVFITPRSFCSGLYFKKFRKWLLQHSRITNLHIFESRSSVFDKNEVLQENIIIKIARNDNTEHTEHTQHTEQPKEVVVSTSKDKCFHSLEEIRIDYEDVLQRRNGDIFIKIPAKETDLRVQHIVNSWDHTLKDLGMKVSTGPVVSFRAKTYLSPEFIDKRTTSPLLWMHNIQGMDVIWPLIKKKKEMAIKIEERTRPLLVPAGNYVLIKRFSSKEQKRRLYAGVLLKSEFDFEKIGIENHLNYLYKCDGMLSVEEAYGIAGILNSSLMDIFFRMINGNTQVNAVDILNLPLPSIELVREIGRLIKRDKPPIGRELDMAVAEVLGIDGNLAEIVNGKAQEHDRTLPEVVTAYQITKKIERYWEKGI